MGGPDPQVGMGSFMGFHLDQMRRMSAEFDAITVYEVGVFLSSLLSILTIREQRSDGNEISQWYVQGKILGDVTLVYLLETM